VEDVAKSGAKDGAAKKEKNVLTEEIWYAPETTIAKATGTAPVPRNVAAPVLSFRPVLVRHTATEHVQVVPFAGRANASRKVAGERQTLYAECVPSVHLENGGLQTASLPVDAKTAAQK